MTFALSLIQGIWGGSKVMSGILVGVALGLESEIFSVITSTMLLLSSCMMHGSSFLLIGCSIMVPFWVVSLMVTYICALFLWDDGRWVLFSRSALVLNTKSASKERLNLGHAGMNVSNRYFGACIICLDGGW